MTNTRALVLAMGVALLGCGGDGNGAESEAGLAKVRVTPTSGLGTDEAGTQVSFRVELTEAPTETVSIRLFSSDESEGIADVSELIFTPTDWRAREVIVTGQADDEVDGNQRYQIVLDEAVSGDLRYQSVQVADVTLTNIDDDAPGVTLYTISDTNTSEDGATSPLRVRLNSRPSAPVSVRLAANPTEGSLDKTEFVFLPRNWNVEQEIWLTGADDLVQDGDMAYQVEVLDVVSADLDYHGLEVAPLECVNLDNDWASFSSEVSGETTLYENSDVGFSVSVQLRTQPIGEVTLECESSDPERLVIYDSTLVFSVENWDEPHVFEVHSIDNEIDDLDESGRVTCRAVSEGADYDGLELEPLDVWIYDDEYSGIVLSASAEDYSTCEGGGVECCIDVSISLTDDASSTLQLSVSSDDPTEGLPSVTSIQLRAADEPVTIQVCGVDDDIVDYYTSYYLIVEVVTSNDPHYPVGTSGSMYLWNDDND